MIRNESVDLFGIASQADADPSQTKPADAKEQRIVNDIKQLYHEAKTAMNDRRLRQETYRLLLKGESALARFKNDPNVFRVVMDGDPRKTRSSDNMMRSLSRAFTAKLIKVIPSCKVTAATADREDLLDAEVRQAWCDYGWRTEKFRLKYKRAVECIPWAGEGILQLYWDPRGGQRIRACPQCKSSGDMEPGDPCPACLTEVTMPLEEMANSGADPMLAQLDAELQQRATEGAPKIVETRRGKLRLRVVHPFDFYPDPSAASIDEAQYAIVARAVPINVARSDFPEMANYIQKEDGLYSDRFISANGNILNSRVETVPLNHHVVVYEYYEMPTGQFPKGRIVYMANDRVLEIKPNVYAYLLDRLPFYFMRGDTDFGELHAEETIGQAEGLQRERDVLGTAMRRWRELMMNPKWMTTIGSGVDQKFMTQMPGEVIKVKPGAQIKPMQVASMPAELPNELARLKSQAMEKFGTTPYEMGQTTAGDSGRFAAFLDTQAASTVSPMLVEQNEEWLELHRAWIILGQHFMPADEVWSISGRDKPMPYTWSNAKPGAGWDIELAIEDSISKNPALRLQQVGSVFQMTGGAYYTNAQGQFDKKRFALAAGLNPELQSPDAEESLHAFAAQLPYTIEQKMAAGEPPPYYLPQPEDDALIFAEELKGWLCSRGKNSDPALVEYVRALWGVYVQALMPAPGQPVDPRVAGVLPSGVGQQGAGQPGAGQAPAGQSGGATSMGAGASPTDTLSPEQETAQKIQGADQKAEMAARQTIKHES